MHPTKRPFDNLLRLKFSKLYRLPFSRYSSFKFWSRDYHVIMTSQKFLLWLSKCPFNQPFIWAAAIGRTCFGSRDIWLLNFDHVTTWSRDFFKKIQIAHATPHLRANWLWGIFFVYSLNPGRIVPPKNYHVAWYIYRYIYQTKNPRVVVTDPLAEVTGAWLFTNYAYFAQNYAYFAQLCIFFAYLCIFT